MSRYSKLFKFSISAIATVTAAVFTGNFLNKVEIGYQVHTKSHKIKRSPKLLTRDEHIRNLRLNEEYDVLVIGGGITGAGCALEAASRGLKTALVELSDFASGSSSKSTKLLHGGVRYLQAAILHLDYEQFKIVKEAILERKTVLEIAPHLTNVLPIMIPVYNYWQMPYYWIGAKIYDLVAFGHSLRGSYFLSKKHALELFPMLKKDKLKGGIVYYDGQMNDARLNLAVIMTAARYGATVCNYVEVTKLYKRTNIRGELVLTGAQVIDHISGIAFTIKAKCIINATGPFTDTIRKMDDKSIIPICSPSSGVHIALPGYYGSDQMGLLDPSTADGRVLFFLPWQKHTIVGTTDTPTEVTFSPVPKESEVLFILSEVKNYLDQDIEIRRGDVLSAWSGIRPLVHNPKYPNSKSLVRNHLIHISNSKLVTISGGKWTTYRHMAEQTVNEAIYACYLLPKLHKSITKDIKVEGSLFWKPTMYIQLVQDFGLECDIAKHLSNTYGTKACQVAKLATPTGKTWPVVGNKIHPDLLYIDAEIRYGIREYACTAIDMISRRLRLSMLNVAAAKESLHKIVDIMAEELKWSACEKQNQFDMAVAYLNTEMGGGLNKSDSCYTARISLEPVEKNAYIERFNLIDKDKKGFISINDIRRTMKCFGDNEISGEQIHEALCQLDANVNGQVDLNEYLQMMSIIKTGQSLDKQHTDVISDEINNLKKNVKIERSGGGI